MKNVPLKSPPEPEPEFRMMPSWETFQEPSPPYVGMLISAFKHVSGKQTSKESDPPPTNSVESPSMTIPPHTPPKVHPSLNWSKRLMVTMLSKQQEPSSTVAAMS